MASPASAHGGGAAVNAAERVASTNLAAVAPAGVTIAWAHEAGSALLDYTDPQNPAFVAAGTYAAVLQMDGQSGPQAGVTAGLLLTVARSDFASFSQTEAPMPLDSFPAGGATVVSAVNAGGTVSAFLQHDAVGNLAFAAKLYVQQLA